MRELTNGYEANATHELCKARNYVDPRHALIGVGCPSCRAEIVRIVDGESLSREGQARFTDENGVVQMAKAYPAPAHPETARRYDELIMAVARKYPNETRHQTALRYILQAETVTYPQDAGQTDAAISADDTEGQ